MGGRENAKERQGKKKKQKQSKGRREKEEKRKKLLVSGKRVHKQCIIPTKMWIIHVN